jgi:tetratricopeptide (TPR) repeat protein
MWWLPLVIALLTAAAFAPAIDNGFTGWDDPMYVINSNLVRDLSPSGLQAIFTTFVMGNYHPLTMMTLAIDYHFWKLNPTGYHRTNIAIHVLATLAVFWLILLLTGSRELSTITSLFFGVHPLHVESVAWVSARKDVLYALFYFTSCISYVLWLRKDRRGVIYYAGALALFALSLLSKGMAATLPMSLIAIDFYLGRRLNVRTLLLEKAPFLILAVAFGVVAVVAQFTQGTEFATFPFFERLLFACYALSAYVIRAVAPLKISAFYPYPVQTGGALPVLYYMAPLFVALIGVAVHSSIKAGRAIAFGALFFLLNVVLVLQLLPIGSAAMADRYTYVSYVGVGFVLACGYRYLARKAFARKLVLRAATMVLIAGCVTGFIFATRERSRVWKDDISLWTDVLHQYPTLPFAYTQRAWAYTQRGRRELAMSDIQQALSLDPKNALALTARGKLYFLGGDYQKARVDLDEAVRLLPTSAAARNVRGAVLLRLKEHDGAIADFSKAIELEPRVGEAYLNRALALCVKEQYSRAIPDFNTSVAYQPWNPESYFWRGEARLQLGDTFHAIEDYGQALQLDPKFGEAYLARSNVYDALRRYDDALRDALQARAAGYPVGDAHIERLRSATDHH